MKRNKLIRKWMKQFVLKELFDNSERRKDDLIEVDKGKIVKMHDILALGVRDYVKSIAKKVIGLDISAIGVDEFKKEFLRSDDDIKITMLYGFLKQKDILYKGKDDFILGKKRDGGFKMLTLNWEEINQDDILDDTDNFDKYISEQIAEKEENIRFSEKTEDVSSFVRKRKKTEFPLIPIRLGRQSMKSGSRGFRDRKKYGDKSKEGGIFQKKGYFTYTKKEWDHLMSIVSPQARANFEERVEQVGDKFQIRLTGPNDVSAEYEALNVELNEAKAAVVDEKSEANEIRLANAVEGMQEHKSRNLKAWLSYDYKFIQSAVSKMPGDPVQNTKKLLAEKSSLIKQYYGKRMKSRGVKAIGNTILKHGGITVDEKGQAWMYKTFRLMQSSVHSYDRETTYIRRPEKEHESGGYGLYHTKRDKGFFVMRGGKRVYYKEGDYIPGIGKLYFGRTSVEKDYGVKGWWYTVRKVKIPEDYGRVKGSKKWLEKHGRREKHAEIAKQARIRKKGKLK